MRRLTFLLAAAPLAFSASARAADAVILGEIEAELAQRKQEIGRQYVAGDGAKPSHAALRERDAKERAALKEILSKRGINPKEYERGKATLNREAKAEAAQAGKAWTERYEADKKKSPEPKVEPPPASSIPVQRGFDEKNPVLLDESVAREDAPAAGGAQKAR